VEAYAIANVDSHAPVDDTVLKAQRGDLAAYEELYRRHVNGVFGLCMRMTASRDQAEELTQQTFTRVWEKLDLFKGGSEFPAWLHRVTVNLVLGDRRSQARKRIKEQAVVQLAEVGGDRRADHPGRSLDLERAIAELPERARQVFVLHDVEGYKHREVGEQLGISAGTSKAQLHRARKRLREALR